MTALRVVFDTNAFTAKYFDALDGSPMRALCRAGRIVPVYGHVFVEETLRAYGNEGKRSDLISRWLPFIADTAQRINEDFQTIWHRELVQGHGTKANRYLTPKEQANLFATFANLPLDGTYAAWQATQLERDAEDAKRAAQREISKDIRKKVADWRKAVNYHPKRHGTDQGFARFFENEVDFAGRGFLTVNVKCSNPHAVADRWTRDKMFYPYFTNFVINMLYIAHCAATRPNDKIDLNAQADLDLMTHLLHADALVSNEAGFLRQAFEDLWRPRGKVLFTSQEFADFARKL